MKFIKILLIVLIPSFGIVSCQKNCAKPVQPANTAVTEPVTTPAAEAKSTGRLMAPVTNEIINSTDEQVDGTEIVGSSDDDREGGDKKKKK